MIGIGIDAVEVERFRRLFARRPRLAERVFTEAERTAMSARVDPVPGLAARFAAKEATMKALGIGLGGVRFAEVEVVRDDAGGPVSRSPEARRAAAEALGVRSWHLSLTHTDSVAAAVVVAD